MTGNEEEEVEVSLFHWNRARIRKGKFFIDIPLTAVPEVVNQLSLLQTQLDSLSDLPNRLKQGKR